MKPYKEIIKNNFSHCVAHYDEYANIQDQCASALAKELPAHDARDILEIGCGTGNFTRLLHERFPGACIEAIDLSPAMVAYAQKKIAASNVVFCVADGENVDTERTYDLIAANAVVQWFSNCALTFARYRDMLKTGGVLIFSAFGPDTFKELNEVMRHDNENAAVTMARRFITRDAWQDMLSSLFKASMIEEMIYTEEVDSLIDLLRKIRYTGTRGILASHTGLLTRHKLALYEARYRELFGTLKVTYQVFICTAEK